MNDSPLPAEGKAYRQSPDGPDLADMTASRGRRLLSLLVLVVGLAALALAAVVVVQHRHLPRWQAPALAGAGVVFAILGIAGVAGGRRNRSTYRFDSSSSRALNTLGRMHGKD